MKIVSNFFRFFGAVATTILSCASDIQISQGDNPWYFNGALERSTLTPVSSPISPIAEENPPAPQSCIARIKPASLASIIASNMRFSSMALPICTAEELTLIVLSVISALEKVAP